MMSTIEDIDFGELYRRHAQLAQREYKMPEVWDVRAQKANKTCGNPQDPYVQEFLQLMDIQGAQTLLDIGCGPGTICLPIAKNFKEVYALDFSQGMLDVVQSRCKAQQIDNVKTITHSWYDASWDDVPMCDITVVSRATMVADMEDALSKVNSKTRLRAYVTSTADPHFFNEGLNECLGRRPVGFPNYIYIVNILSQMGYLPQIGYIHTNICPAKEFATPFDAFVESLSWAAGEFTQWELEKLKAYFDRRYYGKPISDFSTRTWALVSWNMRRGWL